MVRLGAKELRDLEDDKLLKRDIAKDKKNPLFLILEDVYDTYNIGGLFRLADALAVEKLYLCGQMETPPNHRIAKASIGTYKIVPWEYKKTTKEAIDELKKANPTIQIIAVEQDKSSLDYRKIDYKFPLALIVGNETEGVKPETLRLVDHIAEIPMWGVNKSLNVIVSAAILGYEVSKQFSK